MSFRSPPAAPSHTASPAQSTSTLPRRTPSILSPTPTHGHSSLGNGPAPLPFRRPFDTARQVSSASMSMSLSLSVSGASTPDYKRRARRMVERGAKESEAERDWGNVEPDDVFRRLPVGEVRKVEARMRTEALGKQAELRAMVGTRYRDLLTSATQITALHASSQRLSDQLRQVAQRSAADVQVDAASEAEEDDLSLLPAAAHMKLLMDATEALYVMLGNKEYLAAAYLWLVARVTKESLGKLEEGATYQPLLHKQWETLQPFRAQIVQQATELLGARHLDTKTLAETLLAIILLDNLAVPDALALYLSRRKQTLQDVLAHPEHGAANGTARARRRTNSRAHAREAIVSVLSDAVRTLNDTVETSGTIFGQEGESMMENLIRTIQLSEALPTVHAPLRRTSSSASHHRRASRLVSISLPPQTGEGSPMSTTRAIQSLPSSQVLMRYLPPTVLGFTPFITPPQPARLEQVAEWERTAVETLRGAAPQWLADLHSVKTVWEVRALVSGPVEEVWADRVRGIWQSNFDDIVRVVQGVEHGDKDDEDPERFVFSDIAFPSLTTTLNTPQTTVPAFIASLKKRAAYRTPRLDAVLSDLEGWARRINEDKAGLPGTLDSDYKRISAEGLDRLVDALREKSHGLFVGRVALYLAAQSSFLSDLADQSAARIESLRAIHTASTQAWRDDAIEGALAALQPLFDPLRGPIRPTWQAQLPLGPSAPVMHALHALVRASRKLGIPLGVQSDVLRQTVLEYIRRAAELDGWKGFEGDACVQAAVDLRFLGVVAGDGVSVGVDEMLQRTPEELREHLSQALERIVADSIRRTQVLLQPLLAHLPSSALDPPGGGGSGKGKTGAGAGTAGWLRFGPPSTRSLFADLPVVGKDKDKDKDGEAESRGSSLEFRSPVAVAKPGKRFTLVSVAD